MPNKMAITPEEARKLNKKDAAMVSDIRAYIDQKLEKEYYGQDSLGFQIQSDNLKPDTIIRSHFNTIRREKPFKTLANDYEASGWNVSDLKMPYLNQGTLKMTLEQK